MITLAYAIGLTLVLLRNGDNVFAWAPLRYTAALRLGLYGAVAALILSGTTDAIITADFWIADGSRTSAIAAMASLGGVVLLATCIAVFACFDFAKPSNSSLDVDKAFVQRLDAEIAQKGLFRDPDLTISRLSKRLALPARDISQAVNRSTGLNMSQYINNMRIKAVCEILESTEVSVTAAMLEAGFYTKSNFNREFRRVMGQTPTDWRNALK
ncbi:AraC family transcriptional regulator [uncultured Sulfitobacter sp.]|uniref:helix-turn-helix domain-containing protein n=1 Tax=uncultured Sulfitobacter sp. TaxID=191468 RepID=UPI00260B430B|nr:AraC family transcriptional regulator [uncultured Sulfitobacter sp.]